MKDLTNFENECTANSYLLNNEEELISYRGYSIWFSGGRCYFTKLSRQCYPAVDDLHGALFYIDLVEGYNQLIEDVRKLAGRFHGDRDWNCKGCWGKPCSCKDCYRNKIRDGGYI
jgi:hypothetical protein